MGSTSYAVIELKTGEFQPTKAVITLPIESPSRHARPESGVSLELAHARRQTEANLATERRAAAAPVFDLTVVMAVVTVPGLAVVIAAISHTSGSLGQRKTQRQH